MDNPAYNSLTEQLISNGIISSDNFRDEENFFTKPQQKPKEEVEEENEPSNKKRINDYDLELINNSFEKIEGTKGIKKLFYKIFPKLYKARLIKEALAKFLELNIDPNALLSKTIPYGEAEARYKDLVRYLKYANEVQQKLKKKV